MGTLYWCVEEETNFFFFYRKAHIHTKFCFCSLCQSFTFAVPHYHYHHSKRQYKYIENHRLLMPRNFARSETWFGFHFSLEVRPSSKSKRGSTTCYTYLCVHFLRLSSPFLSFYFPRLSYSSGMIAYCKEPGRYGMLREHCTVCVCKYIF